MDLAYVDKLAKNNNGVKYPLVRQDVFDRAVDAKRMKTKDSKETVRAFWTMITKKNWPNKIGVDKEKEFAGEFKKLCKAERIQLHSTMSETKAAFAERTMRSLKSILYRYMEEYGYKYIHKLSQFVTTLISGKNYSIVLILKKIKNSDFFPFCTASHYGNIENWSLKLETELASRSKTYPSRRVIGLILHRKLSKLLQFFPLPENVQHTQ